jgi:hypothetical protein
MIINENDHSALIVLVTATFCAWTVGILGIRITSKFTSRIAAGHEEVAVILSSVRLRYRYSGRLCILAVC